jgi:serine/threonine protein kinase
MKLEEDTLLGSYSIRELLGSGGMGEVYRATDTRLKRDVAVKVLRERLAEDSEALARFEREAQSIAALSHPNILAVHDVGSDEGISFVVMELLQGESLRGSRPGHRAPGPETGECFSDQRGAGQDP